MRHAADRPAPPPSSHGDRVTAVVACMTEGDRPFARAAIVSAVNQTLPGPVHVYVSSGNTWIDALVADLPRIRIRRIPLCPLAEVRNRGVHEANTDLVAFLDGDDVWMPTKTERQVALIDQTGADLVGADHVLIRADGTPFGFAMAGNLPMPSAWLARRAVMLRHPFRDMIGEDGEWWLRTRDTVVKRRLPDFLISYRVRPKSLSSATAGKRRKELACRLAAYPVLRESLLAASWVVHRLTRRDAYVWHDRIGT